MAVSTFGQLNLGFRFGYNPYAKIDGLQNLATYNTAMFKNVENFSNPGITREDGLPGNKNLSIGVSANYEINKFFNIQADLLYLQTGSKLMYRYNTDIQPNANTTYLNLQSVAQLAYASLPVTARFTFGMDSSILKFYIEGGGYAGMLVGKYSSQPEETYLVDQSGQFLRYPKTGGTESNTTWLANENFKSLDYGVVGGIGLTFEVGKGKVDVGARYMYGLANIWGGPDNTMLYNRVINISAGYSIPLSVLTGGGSKNQFVPDRQPDSSTPAPAGN
ncbi:MAG: porin family protein [Bacteroidota bacterium]|nr:porin family protein [Bacteroidota bacterium]